MFAVAVNISFVVVLAWRLVPRFARTAKKWRNKAVAPIIPGLCWSLAFLILLGFLLRLGLEDWWRKPR